MWAGLVATVILGVFMAAQTLRRPGRVLALLVLGTLLPVLPLWVGPQEPAEASGATSERTEPGKRDPHGHDH